MNVRIGLLCVMLLVTAADATAQAPQAAQAAYSDPLAAMSGDVSKISRSVNALTETLKAFVDKFEKVGGLTFNDKQQRLILAMEMLSRAEARVAVLQKAQIDLTEKINDIRAKLAQNEMDLRPRNIDRSVAFAGTTETDELRDNKVAKLTAERASLTALLQQMQVNLNETNEGLKDAVLLVTRLRRSYLPQIEKELLEQVFP
jgi:uncharacterized protein (DUF2344 family)